MKHDNFTQRWNMKQVCVLQSVFGQKPTVWCLRAIITSIAKWHNDYEVKVQKLSFEGILEIVPNTEMLSERVWQHAEGSLCSDTSMTVSWVHHGEQVSMTDRERETQAVTLKEMPFSWIIILSVRMEVRQHCWAGITSAICLSASAFIRLSACFFFLRAIWLVFLSCSMTQAAN